MREIKFRAWHNKWKLMATHIELGSTEANIIVGNTGDILDLNEEYSNLVFMQFTGLHDKNGVEIYEGDIVRYKQRNLSKAFGLSDEGNDDWIEKTKDITFMDQGFNVPGGFIQDLEVIGNIYEQK